MSGSDKGLINTLAEWIDAVSVDGVIIKAADDADAIGVVVFELSGNTYLVESNDTFDNNTECIHCNRYRVRRFDGRDCCC